jgi:DNA repair protein RecN (Recombination protein N)
VLRELHIRNLAVLAQASVEFGPGLNTLTGETGAGKSIVVDSLNLLAGGRASNDLIRTGAEQLTVSGVFEPPGSAWQEVLREAGLDGEGREVLIRREISRGGRNRIFVNDQPATVKLLSELAPYLLRIHGQREETELLEAELQRRWLDRSGGAEAADLVAAVEQAYRVYDGLAARLERLTGDQRLRFERIDLLRFQIGELDAGGLKAGEEEALHTERDQLRYREAIQTALGEALHHLFEDEGAAVARLGRAGTALEEIADWVPEAADWCKELEELRIRGQELASALSRRGEDQDEAPGRLDAVEERLARLERLLRKYGPTSEEALAQRHRLGEELEELEADSADSEELERRAAAALEAYRRKALELSEGRRQWGEALGRRMAAELKDLGLARARLEVALERRRRAQSPLLLDGEAVDFGPHGVDQVVFRFAPNPGEEAQPLARIASGGELSRLSLALQLAAGSGGLGGRPTLVFDEVDTGIGGAQAAALGQKLRQLAAGTQILAVTHLPQVASFGEQQFKVGKRVEGGRTFTEVSPLDEETRVQEIARMLAGKEVTATSLSHARELLLAGQGAPAAKGKAR